jgi:hypothetical protein
MGQHLPLCGQLGPTRSRQGESKEVSIGGVGSKRTSSGGNATTHGTGGTPLVLDSEMALFWAIWVMY